MHLMYWAKAGAWAFVFLMAVCASASIIGAFSGIRPELFSIVGPIFVISGCAVVTMRINGMPIERSEDYLRPRAVAVWLPVLLGLALTTISMLTLWVGLWMAMTFAVMNARRYEWEQYHLKDERGVNRN